MKKWKWNKESKEKIKGKNNPFYGKKHSEYSKKLMSKKRKGKVPYITTEGINKKISETWKRKYKEGFINPMKGQQRPDFKKIRNDPEIKKKRLKAFLEKVRFRPTKPEKLLIEVIEKNNLPFNYTGDGSIWFTNGNEHYNPDFLSKNPKHIIEVFGDYWHNLLTNKEKDKRRLETYSRYGYKTLVIWEHELKDLPLVLNKIKEFIK